MLYVLYVQYGYISFRVHEYMNVGSRPIIDQTLYSISAHITIIRTSVDKKESCIRKFDKNLSVSYFFFSFVIRG